MYVCIGFLAKISRLFASARLGCPEILANRPPFSSNRYIRDIFSREERWSGSNGQRGKRKIRRDIFCMYIRFSIRSTRRLDVVNRFWLEFCWNSFLTEFVHHFRTRIYLLFIFDRFFDVSCIVRFTRIKIIRISRIFSIFFYTYIYLIFIGF